jgi:squalene cyclase
MLGDARPALAAKTDPEWEKAIDRGLKWLVRQQTRLGNWVYPSYGTVPATALAGTAMICQGSTTTQGPYAPYIRKAVDYLLTKVRTNGLIGDPADARYTYGHGFSMLFLSQVLGEEEDIDRREELVEVLTR